jgi:hypothetical protein
MILAPVLAEVLGTSTWAMALPGVARLEPAVLAAITHEVRVSR